MMDELGPEEQRWLDVLRAEEPAGADRARVRAAVLASVAVGAGVAGVAGVATTAVSGAGVGAAGGAGAGAAAGAGAGAAALKVAGTAGTLAIGWKIGIGVAVIALAIGGGAAMRARGHGVEETGAAGAAGPTAAAATTPAATTTAATTTAATTATATTATVAEEPGMAVPAVASKPAPVKATTPPAATTTTTARGSDVEAELVLLTQAQRALEHGSPGDALGALARHGKEFPRGTLAVERDGLRAVATCEAKRSEGRALAERFVAAHPTSPLVARVRSACLSP